jgi:histidinol-phosphate/aromatic aminotransferase/cobyric acid decarboxylase-like protein
MVRWEGPRGFPLGQWVDDHSGVRHNLARSGMAGSLRTVPRLIRNASVGEPQELREDLARLHKVTPEEVFLTHGAHEANYLALAFLAGRARRRARTLRVRVDPPEYPQLVDATRAAGGRVVPRSQRADAWILSNPNNPTGRWLLPGEIRTNRPAPPVTIVDETFRGFTEVSSLATLGDERPWTTGTFTKVYGADEIRVGWSIPPKAETTGYAKFHPAAADKVALRSLGAARAILASRKEVLREVRGIFRENVQALNRAIPGSGVPHAPVWFDQGTQGLPGNLVQAAALRRSILVCSGEFFGDPSGVRLCLTQHSFPEDLARYLEIRDRFTASTA